MRRAWATVAVAPLIMAIGTPVAAQTASSSEQEQPKCVTLRPTATVGQELVQLDVTYCTDKYDTTSMLDQSGRTLPAWPDGQIVALTKDFLSGYRAAIMKGYSAEALNAPASAISEYCGSAPAEGVLKWTSFCGDMFLARGNYASAQQFYVNYAKQTLDMKQAPANQDFSWKYAPGAAAAIELNKTTPNRDLFVALTVLAGKRGFENAKSWLEM